MNKEFKKGQNTKEKILKVALELYSQKGYEGTSIRNIAYKIGIKESAIYNHFKNKEDILENLILSFSNSPTLKKIDSIYLNNKDLATKGKVFLKEFTLNFKLLSFDKNEEKFFKFIVIEMMKNEKIRKYFMYNYIKKYTNILSEAFFIMMQKELIKQNDPIFLAYEFLSPLLFYKLQISLFKLENKDTTILNTIFEKHTDFFWEKIAL